MEFLSMRLKGNIWGFFPLHKENEKRDVLTGKLVAKHMLRREASARSQTFRISLQD